MNKVLKNRSRIGGRVFTVSEQLELYGTKRGKRKSPDGVTTSELICSAHVGTNENVFPLVLSLHVPLESVVADVT